MKLSYIYFYFLILLTLSSHLSAQEIFSVRGIIRDASTGDNLTGVTVLLKGSQNGTVSDAGGNFILSVAPGNYTLVFSYTGYETREMLISIKGDQNISIVLQPEITKIEEIKIIGQRRFFGNMEYGRDIPTIGSKTIELQNSNNASDILHGSVAGVWATKTSGSPGDHEKIRIRGQNSFFSSAEPLYVIDGVPVPIVNMSSLGIADLNIHDIENVTILRDASSTALYGYQGGNGVVLIDMKKGGDNLMSFSTTMGFQRFTNFYDFMPNKDFLGMLALAKNNLGLSLVDHYPVYSDTLSNVNWQKSLFKDAFTKEYQLSGSVTFKKTRVFLSGNYNNQTGILPNSSYKRYTLSTKLSRIFWKKLAIEVGYRCSRQQNKDNQDIYMGNPLILRGINNSPCMLSTADSFYYNPKVEFAAPYLRIFYPYEELTRHESIGDILAYNYHSLNINSHAFNGSARFQINDHLSLNAMESLMLRYSIYNYNSDYALHSTDNFVGSNEQVILYNHQYNLSYYNVFGQNKVDVACAYRYYTDNLWWKVDTMRGTLNNYSYLRNSMAAYGPNGSVIRAINSFVANASYSFRETYFISAVINYSTIREGIHINFDDLFPSVAASWDLSRERPLQTIHWLNNLSIYANWGKSGNYPLNGLANDLYQETQYTYQTGTNNYQAILQLANRNLKQEETEEFDYGLKSSFFDKRILINMTCFKKNITNLIMQRDIPLYYGGGRAFVNVGKLYVTGEEIGLETFLTIKKDFIWHFGFSLSESHQEVKKLLNDRPIIYLNGNDILIPEFRIPEDKPIGDIYGYKCLGAWTSKDDTKNRHYIKVLGMKYLKIDTTTRNLNSKDKVVVGNSIPKFFWNLSNTFQYKDFSITMLWYAVLGVQKFNGTRASTFISGLNRNVMNYVQDSIRTLVTANFYQSSAFVDNAGFVRLKTISFTYEPVREYIRHIKLRFSLSFENLITITKYKGYDPEATTYTDNNFSDNAIDRGSVPNPKSVFVTIGVKF